MGERVQLYESNDRDTKDQEAKDKEQNDKERQLCNNSTRSLLNDLNNDYTSECKLEKEIPNVKLSEDDKEYIRTLYLPADALLGKKLDYNSVYQLHKSLINVESKIEDYLYDKFDIKDSGYASKVLFLLGLGAMHSRVGLNSTFIMHELGHSEAALQQGAESTSYSVNGKEGLNLLDLFVEGLKDPLAKRYTGAVGSSHDHMGSYDSAFSGAGLNVNTHLASNNYKDLILDNGENNSLSKNADYMTNKLGQLYYHIRHKEGGDMNHYVDVLNEKGVDISTKDIAKYQLLSFLISGGSISSINNTFKFLSNGERDSEPIGVEYGGYTFLLPEFNSWMNSDNFSLEILEYIKKGDMVYELGLEKAVIGEGKNSYIMGVNKVSGDESWGGTLKTNGSNSSLSINYSKRITSNSAINLEGIVSDPSYGAGRPDKNFGNNGINATYSIEF